MRLLVARLTKELLLPSAELASHPLVARMAEALRADSDRDVPQPFHPQATTAPTPPQTPDPRNTRPTPHAARRAKG